MGPLALLACLLVFATPGAPALAGVDVRVVRQFAPLAIDEADARRIAWSHGLDHVEEIALVGERWEIAGRDRAGVEAAIDIDARDGAILR